MSLETILEQFEGLDPKRVNSILEDAELLLAQIQVQLPRIQRLVTNIKAEIAAYQAKQEQVRW